MFMRNSLLSTLRVREDVAMLECVVDKKLKTAFSLLKLVSYFFLIFTQDNIC